MVETIFKGSRYYWGWLGFLIILICVGMGAYSIQLRDGLTVTGLSRDVSWGLYIAQLTFLVGVAASAVMLVLPYYLHHYKAFGRIVILGEFLAISAVCMTGLFVLVDVGQPMRFLNLMIHPNPSSPIFWDIVALTGYLILNTVIGFTCLEAERNSTAPPSWVRPLIYLSIPWAVSIHTVTAFLYSGLPGRGFWLTAIMAPRFLASAFAAGPSVLILLGMLMRRLVNFDPGREALQTLAKIVAYAIIAHLFFFFLEVFTVFYSGIPGHMLHIEYLYKGLHGHNNMVPFMWSALVFGFSAIPLLVVPAFRKNEKVLIVACLLVLGCTWIDKGLGLMAGGFIPGPLHNITEYTPSIIEILVTLGIYSIGGLILTILYRMAMSVKLQAEQ